MSKNAPEDRDYIRTFIHFDHFKDNLTGHNLSDTEAAFLYLRQNFPIKENRKFPQIYFLHQVYALLKNKTKVDLEANSLQSEGKIVLFKLGGDKDNIAEIVVFTEDLKTHILHNTNSKIVLKFLDDVLPLVKNVFVDASILKTQHSLTDAHIRELVHENIFVIRDVGSYWLSFPGAGEFVKVYNCGKKEILRIIKKSKYSEILESELRKRKLGKKAILGMEYHISDVIGSEEVRCISTTSGLLLRYDS